MKGRKGRRSTAKTARSLTRRRLIGNVLSGLDSRRTQGFGATLGKGRTGRRGGR